MRNVVLDAGAVPAPPLAQVPNRHPLCPEVGVVALVSNRWTDLWQPRHHVLRRLTKYFNVAWVEPAHEWRHTPARWKGPTPWQADPSDSGWSVYTPPWYLPNVHRPGWLAAALLRTRVRAAIQGLRARGARRIVIYVWRPNYAAALDVAHDLSCYHIDDEYSFSPVGEPLDPLEMALIRRSDLVIIHSLGLIDRKGHVNPNTFHVPNGVDYAAYANPQPEPSDLASIPHPRIGYAGWIKSQLDWALLLELASANRDWSFVFVGDAKPGFVREPAFIAVSGLPHVHFLGRKTPAELTAYPQHLDVCLMPYRVNSYTNCIYPMKLHESLASGRPTVATPIRSLLDYGETVALAATPAELTSAITAALKPAAHTPAAQAARQSVARRHDWDILVRRIAELFAARLGGSVSDRLAAAGSSEIPQLFQGK